MRKLVTLRKISDIRSIPEADMIVCAVVDGWEVVVKKNDFKIGDVAVYFEIDCFLSAEDSRFNFLDKIKRTWEGREGYRIKTIKLKKQVSQGLLLPLSMFPEIVDLDFDADYAQLLNVVKWENIGNNLNGDAAGFFPSYLRKSDQERAQNLVSQIFADVNKRYEVSLKLDGSSITCYGVTLPGEDTGNETDYKTGVCSRNFDLKLPENTEEIQSRFIKMFLDSNISNALMSLNLDVAVQGELCGPGIQANKESLHTHKMFVYNIFDIEKQTFMQPKERRELLEKLKNAGVSDVVEHIPVLYDNVSLLELGISNIKELVAFADGPSMNAKLREGLVFKSIDDDFSFKVISNKWLLGNDE